MKHERNLLPAVLARSVEQLLAALFRLLLRHGMSYVAFESIARRLYVRVALREFGIPGKKPSIARASILSGLTRKEVQRLLSQTDAAATAAAGCDVRENRAVRVLSAWSRDIDFLDDAGQPRALPLQDGATSFAALVRRHSGDMPVRAVLDELQRVGAVQRDGDRVRLLQNAFVPRGAPDKLEHLGSDVADLVRTIEHNTEHGEADPRFQRRVMYHDMPRRIVPAFRKLAATHGMALLVKLDRWLAAEADRQASRPDTDEPQVRLGMGLYYFEDDRKDTTP